MEKICNMNLVDVMKDDTLSMWFLHKLIKEVKKKLKFLIEIWVSFLVFGIKFKFLSEIEWET